MKPKPDFDPDFVGPSSRTFPLEASCGLFLLLAVVAGSTIFSIRVVRAHQPISQVAVLFFTSDRPPIQQMAPTARITVIATQSRGHSFQQTAPRAPVTVFAPQARDNFVFALQSRDHFVVMSNTEIDRQMIHRPPEGIDEGMVIPVRDGRLVPRGLVAPERSAPGEPGLSPEHPYGTAPDEPLAPQTPAPAPAVPR
jgi:hypothetical protein